MAKIVPFPIAHRRNFVCRQATRIAASTPETGERLLARALQAQADTMARRGISPRLIAAQIKMLECAIRVEL
jgi:hypothetical protein